MISAEHGSNAAATQPAANISAVARNKPFRRMWIVLGLSSLGDWLGILATSLFAASQVSGSTAKGAAFGGVIVIRLLPALVLGPIAGVFADRFDRRLTIVISDVLRFVLFASIPLSLLVFEDPTVAVTWTMVASLLTEILALFFIPAKEAAVPNLVPKEQLEAANQLSLITTYGLTPVLAALLLAGLNRGMLGLVNDDASRLWIQPNDAALYFNALTFLIAAIIIFFFIPQIGQRSDDHPDQIAGKQPSMLHSLTDGWRFVRKTAMVRGLVYGILGAFAAGGAVVGVANFYAASLGGGEATFGLMFGTLFVGLGAGLAGGPALVKGLSRHRWFGMSIVLAGASVASLAVAPHLAVSVPLVFFVGVGAGMAYLSGSTLLGREVADEMRGRVFAFVQSMVRVVLMLAIAGASVLVGLGGTREIQLGAVEFQLNTTRLLLALAGVLAIITGVLAFRRMDDKPGVPVLADLWSSIRGRPLAVPGAKPTHGIFIALEGGEGSGKSTQIAALVARLRAEGHDVVDTREPGATPLGKQVRQLLLEKGNVAPTARTEALLYAADRAQHVETVIRPALDRGAIVITDRYIDSSLAYQGAGRTLRQAEVAWLSEWASTGLKPDLVVLLDIDPVVGLARTGRRGEQDRLESESLSFHQRVRQAFLDFAQEEPERYLLIDAQAPTNVITEHIQKAISTLLPPPTAAQNTTAEASAVEKLV